MKRIKIALIGAIATLGFASTVSAATYVTGNVQLHDNQAVHGSDITSTWEVGHTFNNDLGGLTIYAELDGIQLSSPDYHTTYNDDIQNGLGQHPVTGKDTTGFSANPFLTLGGEQSFSLGGGLWAAVGYQHLLDSGTGDTVNYRPLVKLGYDFDNGLSLSNRTRAHLSNGSADNDVRMDNKVAYDFGNVALSYNHIQMLNSGSTDHEVRFTVATTQPFQPYVEYRNQADNANTAVVMGFSYGF